MLGMVRQSIPIAMDIANDRIKGRRGRYMHLTRIWWIGDKRESTR